jgi:hypothetical protein
MRIALGRLACSGIEAHLEGDFAAAVNAALLHYTHRLKSGRAPIGLPPFLRGLEGTQDAEVAFDLTVDRECRELLEQEAAGGERRSVRRSRRAHLYSRAGLPGGSAAPSSRLQLDLWLR